MYHTQHQDPELSVVNDVEDTEVSDSDAIGALTVGTQFLAAWRPRLFDQAAEGLDNSLPITVLQSIQVTPCDSR